MNKWISRVPREKPTRKRATCRAHDWKMKSHARQEIFTSVSWERPSRKVLMKLSVWQKVIFCFTKSLPTLYIPSLPTNCNECFLKKKHHKIYLRVRDCYTYNHLHIFLWFSSTPTSPSLHPWEVASLNTYNTHSEYKVRIWCCWEALEGAIHWQM